MSDTLKHLNALQKLVIEQANQDGILLSDQFESPEAFRKFIISLAIRGVMEMGGLTIREALDLVLGEGTFQKIADDVWEANQKDQS